METALFAGFTVSPKPGHFSRWNCSVATPRPPDTSPRSAASREAATAQCRPRGTFQQRCVEGNCREEELSG